MAPVAENPHADPVPGVATEVRHVRVERDDAARLRAFVTAVETHGPLPVPESAAVRSPN